MRHAAVSTLAIIAVAIGTGMTTASAQTPTPTATRSPTVTVPTASPSATRAAVTPTPIGASGSITLNRSSGGVGDVVHVHGEGFPTSVAAYFVCRVNPAQEFASDFTSGTSFDVDFTIPSTLNEIQGSGVLLTQPGLECGFGVTPPYIDRVPFTVVSDGPGFPGSSPTSAPPFALPNTGGGRQEDRFAAVIAIAVLAAIGGAALVLGEKYSPR